MSQHLKSPYNFVPMADFVHEPEWAAQVSQDIPFADGLSGVLECELTAHTPLHIGSGDKEDGQPVMLNGEPIIPGSSLKGMIRNVLGIACFGRFNRFDDYRMSLRDLTPAARPVYGNRMVRQESSTGDTVPRVKAGWLHLIDGVWHLESCKHRRIEHSDLTGMKGGWLTPGQRKDCTSKEKYSQWSQEAEDFRIRGNKTSDKRQKGPRTVRFDKLVPHPEGELEGWLVFTGQPGPNKHMEFVFHDESGKPRRVPDGVWRDFQMIHKDTKEWEFLTSESPYWQAFGTVPVFYLSSKSDHGPVLEAIGLAQMFRLPYKHAIGELVPDKVKIASSQGHLDLTDLMFGDAFQRGDDPFCRGRIQFGLGRPVGEVKPGKKENLILSTPRPSFYPAYVQQDKNGKPARTYSDDDARLAGWKRYPAAGEEPRKHPGLLENNKMNQHGNMDSPIRALPEGKCFRFKVRFHNLKPEELGALHWALALGGNEQLRHRLGKGKPYGYGEISIRCIEEESCIRPNSHKSEAVPGLLEQANETFVQHMNNVTPGSKEWRSTEQVRALLAMSDPAKSNADELCYYPAPKDYQTAKGNNRDQPMKTLRKFR